MNNLRIIALHQKFKKKKKGMILGPRCSNCEEGYIKTDGYCFCCRKYDESNFYKNYEICSRCGNFYLDKTGLCEVCNYCYGCNRLLTIEEKWKYCKSCILSLDLYL